MKTKNLLIKNMKKSSLFLALSGCVILTATVLLIACSITIPPDRERSPFGDYSFYFGDLHAHTGYSGDMPNIAKNMKLTGTDKSLDELIPDWDRTWNNDTDWSKVLTEEQMMALDQRYNPDNPDRPKQLPRDDYDQAKILGLDFMAVTDHSNVLDDSRDPGAKVQSKYYQYGFMYPNDMAHWNDTKQSAERATVPGKFIGIHGYEFSKNSSYAAGHMNVFNTENWASALPNVNTYPWLFGKPEQAPNYDPDKPPQIEKTMPWEKENAEKNGTRAFVQINHPGRETYKDWIEQANPRSVMYTDRNGNVSKEPMNYNQYVRLFEMQSNANKARSPNTTGRRLTYHKVLNLGWKVGATHNSDTHGTPNYISAANHEKRATVVLAPALTKNDIIEALYQRRVFASYLPRLQMDYRLSINGVEKIMGEEFDFDAPPSSGIKIKVFAKDLGYVNEAANLDLPPVAITRIEVIGGIYSPGNPNPDSGTNETAYIPNNQPPEKELPGQPVIVKTVDVGSYDMSAGYQTEFTIEPCIPFDYYYLQVWATSADKDNPIATTTPVWMDNK